MSVWSSLLSFLSDEDEKVGAGGTSGCWGNLPGHQQRSAKSSVYICVHGKRLRFFLILCVDGIPAAWLLPLFLFFLRCFSRGCVSMSSVQTRNSPRLSTNSSQHQKLRYSTSDGLGSWPWRKDGQTLPVSHQDQLEGWLQKALPPVHPHSISRNTCSAIPPPTTIIVPSTTAYDQVFHLKIRLYISYSS